MQTSCAARAVIYNAGLQWIPAQLQHVHRLWSHGQRQPAQALGAGTSLADTCVTMGAGAVYVDGLLHRWRVFVDGVPLLGPHYCLPNGQVRGIPYNADASPSCVASMATQSFPENIIAPAFRVSC